MTSDAVWPLFALRVETPRLVLRCVRDDDLEPLTEAVLRGVHDPSRMPFGVPWTDAAPDALRRSFAQFQWRLRAELRPEDWWLGLTVLHEGEPIGVQDVRAKDFGALRTISSGSWLTREAQGRGFGTEMRAGLLQLAFDHLGAEWADSGALVWNAPSLAVSRRLGYEPNGTTTVRTRPDVVDEEQLLRLHRDRFIRPGWTASVVLPDAAREQLVPS